MTRKLGSLSSFVCSNIFLAYCMLSIFKAHAQDSVEATINAFEKISTYSVIQDQDLENYLASARNLLEIKGEIQEESLLNELKEVSVIFVSGDDTIIDGKISPEILDLFDDRTRKFISDVDDSRTICKAYQLQSDTKEVVVIGVHKSDHDIHSGFRCVNATLGLIFWEDAEFLAIVDWRDGLLSILRESE